VVDDCLITSPSRTETISVVNAILKKFDGTHGGKCHHYVGMKGDWDTKSRSVLLSQPSHVQEIMHQFRTFTDDWTPRSIPIPEDLKLTSDGTTKTDKSPLLDVTKFPYRSLIGAMSYLACTTRPDIAYTVNQLARFSHAPTVAHWEVAINCLRYLGGTQHLGIVLGQSKIPACAYVDASHGTGTPDGKSISGYCVSVYGGPVIWASKTQRLSATSTTESEYRAMSDVAKEVIWLCGVLKALCVPHRPFPIYGDNKGSLDAVKCHGLTKHTKHLSLHVQFMREAYEQGLIKFIHVKGVINPADMLTKPLVKTKFLMFRQMIGMAGVKGT
jgi:hypothetical protein